MANFSPNDYINWLNKEKNLEANIKEKSQNNSYPIVSLELSKDYMLRPLYDYTTCPRAL